MSIASVQHQPAYGPPSAGDSGPHSTRARDACPLCGAPLRPEQDWCLHCGAAARTRLAAAPNWRAPLAIFAAIVAILLGVLAAGLVKLAAGSGTLVTSTRTVTAPAAAVVTPAPAATTATAPASSAATTTATTPRTAASGSSATTRRTVTPLPGINSATPGAK